MSLFKKKLQEKLLINPAIEVVHKWPMNMIESDIIDFKEGQSYSTSDVYLKLFCGVWVSPDSIIYKNGSVVRETLPFGNQVGYYRFRHLIKKFLIGQKVYLNSKKKYLLVTDIWSSGHFHWFSDVLPKLLCIENLVQDFTLLLPDTPYIRNIAIKSLELLQLQFENIILMKKTEFYKIKNLYYVSAISKSGQMHPELMKKLKYKFIGNAGLSNKRIYISREKSKFRKIVNETNVIEKLKNYDFEILYSEDLTLLEQIGLFSTCDTLLGIHGAGLTNCIFMQDGSSVIEIKRKENGPLNVGYWHLADSLAHNYFYYNGIPNSDLPLVGKGGDLKIDVLHFENCILKNLK